MLLTHQPQCGGMKTVAFTNDFGITPVRDTI
jgi:hypothetical protein